MAKKIVQQKVLKFLLGGGVAAAINLALIYALIEVMGFSSPILRNIANVIAIEVSLIASFFIYRLWVWKGGSWRTQDLLWRQLPLYHVSAGSAIVIRVFLVFPLLDRLGIHYGMNTLVGVLLSASINYIISDRVVFKTKSSVSDRSITKVHYPESLSPALLEDLSRRADFNTSPPQVIHKIECLSIVIPAHNEEGCIVETINAIIEKLDIEQINYEILVINDNSRDRTEELLKQLSHENSRVRYLNNYYPNGFGLAVQCGLENFKGDAVAIVMADNSDSPQNIVDYYHKLQDGYHCVFGSRFIKGGKVIDYPGHKLVINRLANLFIKVLFGLDLNDTTNAFKMYRREVIKGISPLLSHHFNLTVEMPLKAIVRGYSYTIIPITWQNRKTGISKLKLQEMGSRYLFIVLYIFLEKNLSRGDYVRKSSPI